MRCVRARRVLARAVCWLAWLTLSGPWLASRAEARGLSVGLHWTRGQGAEQCIGPIELARRIEARLGRPLFEPAGTAELALEARVERDAEGDGFHAHLAVVDENGIELGARELSAPGPDCRALDEALTLVIAVTLYPEGGLGGFGIALPNDVAGLLRDALEKLEAQAPAPAPAATKVATRQPVPREQAVEPTVRDAADAEARAPQVRLGGAGLLRAGASPDATLGAQLSLGLAPAGWPLFELSAAVVSEDDTAFSLDGSAGTLRVSASRFALAVCPEALQGALELRGCLGAEALIMSANTDGLTRDGDLSVVVPNVTLGARAALWLVPSFALSFGAGLTAPLQRPELRVETRFGRERPVFEQPSVGGELSAGLTWRASP